MKSILEEASTIMKAIEKGWIQAGKPREFSIKVLEEPVKNFIGMTTKSAKIGFFFDERATAKKAENRDNRQQPRKEREHAKQPVKAQPRPHQQPAKSHPATHAPRAHTAEQKQDQVRPIEPRPRNEWTDDLVQNAQEWITQCLRSMDKSHVRFTATPKQAQLVITFQHPVIDDQAKERTFFRSSSYLLMQSLRSQSKKSLRGLTLLLTNA